MSAVPGPGMRAVVEYVTAHPGCSKADAGRYDSVERAIRRGLIRAEQDHPAGRYRLFLPDAGRDHRA